VLAVVEAIAVDIVEIVVILGTVTLSISPLRAVVTQEALRF
jgi:hypothetical protein